jgi:hypothetical protein
MKKVLFSILLLASGLSQAGITTTSGITRVTGVSSYTQNNGDVIFRIESPIAACDGGYWLSKSDAGFNANLAMVMSAYNAKSPIQVYGLSDQIWNGSASKFCKLYVIELH